MTKVRVAAGLAAIAVLAVGGTSVAAAAGRRPPRPPRPVPTTTTTTAPAPNGPVTVTITGGHDTDPVDHGRPVVLIAAALGVPTEVFRTAFNGVMPSRNGQPTAAEAQANKAALLGVLAPYGVTNERLDEVSNHYRYVPASGSLWRHVDAAATYAGGVVTITAVGAGYTTPPTVTISAGGLPTTTATAALHFGTDLATNGSIASITVP